MYWMQIGVKIGCTSHLMNYSVGKGGKWNCTQARSSICNITRARRRQSATFKCALTRSEWLWGMGLWPRESGALKDKPAQWYTHEIPNLSSYVNELHPSGSLSCSLARSLALLVSRLTQYSWLAINRISRSLGGQHHIWCETDRPAGRQTDYLLFLISRARGV